MTKAFHAAAIFAAVLFPNGQVVIPRPEVPDNIKVTSSDHVVLQVHHFSLWLLRFSTILRSGRFFLFASHPRYHQLDFLIGGLWR